MPVLTAMETIVDILVEIGKGSCLAVVFLVVFVILVSGRSDRDHTK